MKVVWLLKERGVVEVECRLSRERKSPEMSKEREREREGFLWAVKVDCGWLDGDGRFRCLGEKERKKGLMTRRDEGQQTGNAAH